MASLIAPILIYGSSTSDCVRRPYNCPVCLKPFSRKYNLRVHCKRKHGFDPAPVSPELKYGFIKGYDGQVSRAERVEEKLGTALNRVRAALSKTKVSEELRTGSNITWAASDFREESAISKLLDDNIFLSKKEFEAISGYLCPRCMTFDYSYIKRIGVDLNEEKKHRCNTAALIRADNIKDRRIKGELLTDIELQAIDYLYELAISQFGPTLRLVAKRLPFVVMPQESLIGKTYAPAIIADSIHSSGYAWLERAIIDKKYGLEEQQLWEFIYNTGSTYSIAVILKGLFRCLSPPIKINHVKRNGFAYSSSPRIQHLKKLKKEATTDSCGFRGAAASTF